MRTRTRLVTVFLALCSAPAFAQTPEPAASPPPSASYDAPPAPTTVPTSVAPTSPPAAAPAPEPAPPTSGGYAQNTYSPPQVQGGYAPSGYYEPPPPPAPEEHHGFQMPPWSVRIDPFNLLLDGRLGIELEVGVLSFMSAELVPVFVVNAKPPTLNFAGVDDPVRQGSNGLGALAGTSIDLGFWLSGHALRGYVIRAIFQNYGYEYRTVEPAGLQADRFVHTDRVLMGMFGSHSRWGAFTIAGGIGLGVDLNNQERCYNDGDAVGSPQGHGCSELQLKDKNTGGLYDVQGAFYPVVLDVRFSLGVSFD